MNSHFHDLDLPEGARIEPDGLWIHLHRPSAAEASGTGARRPALFLDRDGVIIEDGGYLHRPDDVCLIAGAVEVIARANDAGVPVVIVTNQGGIGLGLYGWADFIATQERILEKLSHGGGAIDAVMASPHHPKGEPPYNDPAHSSRKPNPGMILKAAELLDIELSASWIVGDHATDVEAGFNAGLSGGIHVMTGHGHHAGERDKAIAMQTGRYRVHGAESIRDALTLIPFLAKA